MSESEKAWRGAAILVGLVLVSVGVGLLAGLGWGLVVGGALVVWTSATSGTEGS